MRLDLTQRLVGSAYPLWSRYGIDPSNGGFVEAIDQDGMPLGWPRRARIHPRQMYAFVHARTVEWQGDAAGIARRGMNYFMRCYRREDGLFVTLADAEGTVMDQRVLLYDQAFALLGYAAAGFAFDADVEFEALAPGLWFDVQTSSGERVESPAQASTFYHVVGAVLALNLALPKKT
jgi:mannose/cellobiose epimerase-like protein (N-acyl-D-glucosamine 2-epimerase family)